MYQQFCHGLHQTHICLTKLKADSKSIAQTSIAHKPDLFCFVLHCILWLCFVLFCSSRMYCVCFHSQVGLHFIFCSWNVLCLYHWYLFMRTVVATVFIVLFMFFVALDLQYHQNLHAQNAKVCKVLDTKSKFTFHENMSFVCSFLFLSGEYIFHFGVVLEEEALCNGGKSLVKPHLNNYLFL